MNAQRSTSTTVAVPHIIKGELVLGTDCEYGSADARFATPALKLDSLVWPRTEPGPAFDTPIAEILSLLAEVGEQLKSDSRGLLAQACEQLKRTSPLDAGILERDYANLWRLFKREYLELQIEAELGGPEAVDGWRDAQHWDSHNARVRAFPPRLVHILAGNAPGVAAISVIRGALTKGVHLLKLPSNDLFSASGVLRTMAAAAPGHPLTRSFSAVYWRGGDASIEGRLMQPQFFDKLVAWGGESALRSAKKYIGPGFELVAFDPKTSISLIGREAFASEALLQEVARLAGDDATPYNQGACVSSRFQFVEGELHQIDRYCELLQEQLGIERPSCSSVGMPVTSELRQQVEVLRHLPEFRVWGTFDGRGLVIRSEEPVDFYPDRKIVNVVPVRSLHDAVRFANVATQTVGVYPPERKVEVRDALASAGVQRVVSLGTAGSGPGPGLPHDSFYPLHRFVRWVTDEN